MDTKFFFLALFALLGCARQIGDERASSIDCDTGHICDTLSEGGYCTIDDCEESGCPTGATCVVFENNDSFCMNRCLTTAECRSGYVCFAAENDLDYCRVSDE